MDLTIAEKDEFYKSGVTLALVAFVMLVIPLTISMLDHFFGKKTSALETCGSELLAKILNLSNTIGGIIGLVSAGKSIYSFDCISFGTCDELYRTLFTVYFWVTMGYHGLQQCLLTFLYCVAFCLTK